MKKLIKPASLLLYLLSLLVFFLAGMVYAGVSGVAKGQGLAGGAIVLGYGVMFGIIALVVSIFIAFYVKHRAVVITNRILAVVFAVMVGIMTFRIMSREGKATPEKEVPHETTGPASID